MQFYDLQQLVSVARRSSKFYSELYRDLPEAGFRFEEIPVATFDRVMAAVHNDYRAMFASQQAYGMCYTTSGTTGKPKATLFGRDEWRTINQMLATVQWKTGLIRDGDVICNISEPGSASFMAIHRVVDLFPGRCSEIPIGCDTSYENIIRVCRQFGATVIAGMNPTILGLAVSMIQQGEHDAHIRMLLGGGELLYGVGRQAINRAFPRAQLCPFFYGTTEAGMIGYSDLSLAYNEFYVFEQMCKLEILDPRTHEVISEAGKLGTAVVTSFVRLVTPAIRFDTGDLVMWIDPPDVPFRRFSLHGRVFPYVYEVAGVRIREEHVSALIAKLDPSLRILRLQMVLNGNHECPGISIVLTLYDQDLDESQLSALVLTGVDATIPLLRQRQSEGRIRSVSVSPVDFSYFEPGTRRKSRLILDKRMNSDNAEEQTHG